MTPPRPGYTPVDCAAHDRLESWAVRGAVVSVVWRDGDAERRAETTVSDVYAHAGADWVRLGTGDAVRADRLVTVGGVEMGAGC